MDRQRANGAGRSARTQTAREERGRRREHDRRCGDPISQWSAADVIGERDVVRDPAGKPGSESRASSVSIDHHAGEHTPLEHVGHAPGRLIGTQRLGH